MISKIRSWIEGIEFAFQDAFYYWASGIHRVTGNKEDADWAIEHVKKLRHCRKGIHETKSLDKNKDYAASYCKTCFKFFVDSEFVSVNGEDVTIRVKDKENKK